MNRSQLTEFGRFLVQCFGAFCVGIILAAAFFGATGVN